MRHALDVEIEALARAFVEDLAKLVLQQTLEVVLERLEAGESGAPKRPGARRRRSAKPEKVVLEPARRRARRRPEKEAAGEPVPAPGVAPVASEPLQIREAVVLEEVQPPGLVEALGATA